jgi:hypothetical protein
MFRIAEGHRVAAQAETSLTVQGRVDLQLRCCDLPPGAHSESAEGLFTDCLERVAWFGQTGEVDRTPGIGNPGTPHLPKEAVAGEKVLRNLRFQHPVSTPDHSLQKCGRRNLTIADRGS